MSDIISDYFDEKPMKKTEEKCSYVIGIDLGTCNSCCCVWRNNSPEVICDEYGNRTFPSIVAFIKNKTYIGIEAKNQIDMNTKNVFYETKRLIGKKFSDSSISNDQKFLSYDICSDIHNNVNVVRYVGDDIKLITPEEISSYILLKFKSLASEYLKCEIRDAVISVPAYFNDAQRQATYDASKIAGLNCLRIISEPIASALAYGLNKMSKQIDKEINIVVYDLGGGTLDVSLLSINNGVFEVIGSAGNTHLGGVDFDKRIYDYCISSFKLKNPNVNFDSDNISCYALQRLRNACENAKKTLTTSNHVIIGVSNFYDDINLIVTLTNEKFIEICNDLFVLCLKPLDDILNGCDITRDQIDEIILVGGMTRNPTIRKNIQNYFNKIPNYSVNPDETVAYGASIQGYILCHKNDPFSESITLLDTTPLSLGVETIGGVMNFMIKRGTIIPATEKKIFTNDTSNETSVMIKIYEGERKLTRDNFHVGEFELCGLTPAPCGYHQIEITFSIDINGIITVSAKDLRKNSSNIVRINSDKGRLSEEHIRKMIETAKEYEINDKLNKKKKKAHFQIRELCDNIMKNINFRETNIPTMEKETIQTDIDNIINILKQPYDTIDLSFYESELKRLEDNYCVLILKIDDDTKDYQSYYNPKDTQTTGTSVFQNDDADNKMYSNIISNELGYDEDMNIDELNEIKRLRDTLIENCHNIMNISDNVSLFKSCELMQELKENIEDILVWLHIQPKFTIQNLEEKMRCVEDKCNECVLMVSNLSSPNDELMTLCKSIENSIEMDVLSIENKNIEILKNIVDETMSNIKDNKITNDECLNKIQQINELCNNIYDAFVTQQ